MGNLDKDVLHRCLYFYVLRFIRMQRLCGIRYTTESVLSRGAWTKLSEGHGMSFRRPFAVTPMNDDEREFELDIVMRLLGRCHNDY